MAGGRAPRDSTIHVWDVATRADRSRNRAARASASPPSPSAPTASCSSPAATITRSGCGTSAAAVAQRPRTGHADSGVARSARTGRRCTLVMGIRPVTRCAVRKSAGRLTDPAAIKEPRPAEPADARRHATRHADLGPAGRAPAGSWPPPDLTGQTIGDFHDHPPSRPGRHGVRSISPSSARSNARSRLKFLRPELAANPTALSRFRRRPRPSPGSTHANIVQVYSINAERAAVLHGPRIRRGPQPPRVPRAARGRRTCRSRLTIMRQVAAALQRAAGIQHRPPRHQAGKHPADAQGRGQGRRFRPVPRPDRRRKT